MRNVSGRNVLITGAAMGMGRLFAERAIAEQAASVILVDIDAEALNATAEELSGQGTEIIPEVLDVRRLPAIRAAARRVQRAVGPVHIVLNNAGVVRGNQYFWETDPVADAKFTIEVNTLAPMYVARVFLPEMIESREECRLVNIASAAGLTANPRMAVYAGSKWAVVGWSDSVRLELDQAGHRHVKVTTVCPYYVKTGMFDGAKSAPLLPLLDPADVVNSTWKAMCNGDPMLVLPRTVILGEAFKGIMPVQMRDFISDKILGVYHTMEDFTGRA